MVTCKDCLHNHVCALWRAQEGQDAKCYSESDDWGCDYFADKSRFIEINEDFESILICAERYACGRQTYMTSIVVGYITPLIPQLSDKTLAVIRDDIGDASVYRNLGDSRIDAPLWLKLYRRIDDEIKRRAEANEMQSTGTESDGNRNPETA